jgi:hypothetical protein
MHKHKDINLSQSTRRNSTLDKYPIINVKTQLQFHNQSSILNHNLIPSSFLTLMTVFSNYLNNNYCSLFS